MKDGVEEDEEEEETRKPIVGRVPKTPTKKELEEHLPLHIEYRDWCPHCVAGKATSRQHRTIRDEGDEKMGITISLDYCFMTPEEQEDDMRPILAAHDNSNGAIWAVAVDKKGVSVMAVRWLTGKLEEAGYAGQKITLKSDQEEGS